MRQNSWMGKNDDQYNVAKDANKSDNSVYTTIENGVNYVVIGVAGHGGCGYCGCVGSCPAFMPSLSMNTQMTMFDITLTVL